MDQNEVIIHNKIRKLNSQLADIVTIAPNGTDDTTAIQTVLDSGKVVRLIQGNYIVSSLTLNDGAKILTSGYKTKLKQKTGVAAGTRILVVQGNNVVVDEMTYEGNITTDTGEQNHAVFIYNNTKTIENINIKGIIASNIRGDGIYIGGTTNYNPTNVKIGMIKTTNCYRNGFSITGGLNVEIGDCETLNSGMLGFDLESDTAGGHINRVNIGNVITSNVGIIAQGTGYNYAENVNIGFIELKKSRQGSSPDYPSVGTDNDGITFRNARNINIKGLNIDGFDRHAILFNFSGSDRYSDQIVIDNLTVSNCSLVDTTYNSYINISGANLVKINNIYSTVQTGANKDLIKGSSKTANEQNVIVENAIHAGGRFANMCGIYAKNIKATSDIMVFGSLKQLSKVQNSNLTGATYLVTYSDNVIFEGNTITYTTGRENNGTNIYRNNIINTVYTA